MKTFDQLRHRKCSSEDMPSKANVVSFYTAITTSFSSKTTPHHEHQQASRVSPNQGKKRLNSTNDSLKHQGGESLGLLQWASVSSDRKSFPAQLDHSATQGSSQAAKLCCSSNESRMDEVQKAAPWKMCILISFMPLCAWGLIPARVAAVYGQGNEPSDGNCWRASPTTITLWAISSFKYRNTWQLMGDVCTATLQGYSATVF